MPRRRRPFSTRRSRLEAPDYFGGMVLGGYQSAVLLGVDVDLTKVDIDRIAREATVRSARLRDKMERQVDEATERCASG